MIRSVRLLAILSAAVLINSACCYAEEAVNPAEKVGSWRFSMDEGSGKRGHRLKGLLQEITRSITALPVMSPPKGFEARFWGFISPKDRFDICTGKKCPPSRPTAVLAMMIGRYEPKGESIKAAFGTPSTMDISINNIGHVFASLPVLYKDDEGFILPEPVLSSERAGLPTYVNRGHAVAVVTTNDRPLWLPVSRERYLKAAIATETKSLETPPEERKKKKRKKSAPEAATDGRQVFIEQERTWIDPVEEKKMVEKSRIVADTAKESDDVIKERIRSLQEELNVMTAEQRTTQARIAEGAADNESVPLLPHDSTAGVPVVTPNFRYFNPKLPPDAPQLAVIQWKFDGDTRYDPESSSISETLNNRVLLEIYKNMDWKKLRGRITRTAP